MPDKDDKRHGNTSLPGQYERDDKEFEAIEDGHKPSFKSSEDREAEAPRNHDKPTEEEKEARNVPATKQG